MCVGGLGICPPASCNKCERQLPAVTAPPSGCGQGAALAVACAKCRWPRPDSGRGRGGLSFPGRAAGKWPRPRGVAGPQLRDQLPVRAPAAGASFKCRDGGHWQSRLGPVRKSHCGAVARGMARGQMDPMLRHLHFTNRGLDSSSSHGEPERDGRPSPGHLA